jgi:hypothetical protein
MTIYSLQTYFTATRDETEIEDDDDDVVILDFDEDEPVTERIESSSIQSRRGDEGSGDSADIIYNSDVDLFPEGDDFDEEHLKFAEAVETSEKLRDSIAGSEEYFTVSSGAENKGNARGSQEEEGKNDSWVTEIHNKLQRGVSSISMY